MFILQHVLDPQSSRKIEVIPDDYRVLDGPCKLDRSTLESWDTTKLYCFKRLEIAKDVTPQMLEEKLVALKARGVIYCPENLRPLLMKKSADSQAKFVTYKDTLLVVDTNYTLTPSYLKYAAGQLTLVVEGNLEISKEVDPDQLFGKLDKVYNYGNIEVHGDQLGAIQAKLEVNEGNIDDAGAEDPEDESDENRIGNIGYLKL